MARTARVASYYGDSADDAYGKDGEGCIWQGKGAKALGLKGKVESETFRKLLAGNLNIANPKTSSQQINQATTHPIRQTTRQDSNSRIGIDFIFSAPKSVSMQALLTNDKNIIAAHDKAVKRVLEVAEAMAEARTKINGKTYTEKTKNLTIAKFRHETSRENDPQLHTHCVIMNLTLREDGKWCALKNDELIKSTKYLGALYRSEFAINLQKVGYELRQEREGFFELAHISQEQIDEFSRRSNQIELLLETEGLTRMTASTEQKQLATMKTRPPKVNIPREELVKNWHARAKELGIDFDHTKASYARDAKNTKEGKGGNQEINAQSQLQSKAIKITLTKALKAEAAKLAVRFAINHLTERESVISKSKLLDIALKHSVGSASLPDIRGELAYQVKKGYIIQGEALYKSSSQTDLKKDQNQQQDRAQQGAQQPQTKEAWVIELMTTKGMTKTKAGKYVRDAIKQGRLIKLEARYTTERALTREARILQIERGGRSSLPPIMREEAASIQLAETNLNQGQRQAALLMLTTTNRIVGIQGYAGTGKSHMLATAKKMIEEHGYHIQALAPYGSQVKALKINGINARTLASFLKTTNKAINDKSVIIIDEAGVIPTRQMEQTLKLIEKTNARVVLLGDTAQTKAIEAGKPFDQLQNQGMSTAHMDKIERQKNKILKEAVELAAKGDTRASLGTLQSISKIIEIKDQESRLKTIAEYYVTLPQAERDETIIVSGTNLARRYINHEVREGLKRNGQLGAERDASKSNENENENEKARSKEDSQEKVFKLLTKYDTTREERKHSKYYNVGDIISPEKDHAKINLKQNELYQVESNGANAGEGNRLTVKSKEGELITFSPMTHNRLYIYRLQNTELAIGDRVRVTRNDKKLGLTNGDRLKVKDIQDGHIVLTRIGTEKTIDNDKNKSRKNEGSHESSLESSRKSSRKSSPQNSYRGEDGGKDKNKTLNDKTLKTQATPDIKLSTRKPLYLDHAYAATVHSSQGLDAGKVICDFDAKSPTTAKDIYYVAISRARKEVHIYTNSIDELPKAISRERVKSAALDLEIDKNKPDFAREHVKHAGQERDYKHKTTPNYEYER